MLPFTIAAGDQTGQVTVPRIILNQQHQAKRLIGIFRIPDPAVHAEYGLYPGGNRCFVKPHQRKQIALIGQCNRWHINIDRRSDQLFNPQ